MTHDDVRRVKKRLVTGFIIFGVIFFYSVAHIILSLAGIAPKLGFWYVGYIGFINFIACIVVAFSFYRFLARILKAAYPDIYDKSWYWQPINIFKTVVVFPDNDDSELIRTLKRYRALSFLWFPLYFFQMLATALIFMFTH